MFPVQRLSLAPAGPLLGSARLWGRSGGGTAVLSATSTPVSEADGADGLRTPPVQRRRPLYRQWRGKQELISCAFSRRSRI